MRAYRPLPKDAVLTLVRRAAIAALAAGLAIGTVPRPTRFDDTVPRHADVSSPQPTTTAGFNRLRSCRACTVPTARLGPLSKSARRRLPATPEARMR